MMLAIGDTVVMSWIFKYCWMGISGSLYAMGTDMATIGGTAPEAETLGEALSMMFSNGIFGIGNGVWPVSYTHLDVYKRQLGYHVCHFFRVTGINVDLVARFHQVPHHGFPHDAYADPADPLHIDPSCVIFFSMTHLKRGVKRNNCPCCKYT